MAKITHVTEVNPINESKSFPPAHVWASQYRELGAGGHRQGEGDRLGGATIGLCSLPDTKPLFSLQTHEDQSSEGSIVTFFLLKKNNNYEQRYICQQT